MDKRDEQIGQHHQPKQQGQQLPQPPKHLHTRPRRELLFASTVTASMRDKPEGEGKFFRQTAEWPSDQQHLWSDGSVTGLSD
jgi:hypothetical protein